MFNVTATETATGGVLPVGVVAASAGLLVAVVTVDEAATVGRFVDCTVGKGDGVVGGAIRCGDSGGCEESSSIDETLPWAWL